VLDVTPRVSYEQREYSPRPDAFGGGVSVRTTDGRTFSAELRYQRGGAENPMTDDEVREKYRANAGLLLDTSAVAALEDAVAGIEERPDLKFFTAVRA
jgi:2-methylcitrate dehydratase PrpD